MRLIVQKMSIECPIIQMEKTRIQTKPNKDKEKKEILD
jgi:hypothetical protein